MPFPAPNIVKTSVSKLLFDGTKVSKFWTTWKQTWQHQTLPYTQAFLVDFTLNNSAHMGNSWAVEKKHFHVCALKCVFPNISLLPLFSKHSSVCILSCLCRQVFAFQFVLSNTLLCAPTSLLPCSRWMFFHGKSFQGENDETFTNPLDNKACIIWYLFLFGQFCGNLGKKKYLK